MASAGCGSLKHFPFDAGSPLQPETGGLWIRFVGVGCCLLQWGSTAILTDPFWSHLPLGRVAFGRLAPDPAQVEGHLPNLAPVQAIAIGHGHYDHLLDLPWVCEQVHPEARILTSQSVVHQYAALRLARPFEAVDHDLATESSPGRWFHTADGRARILPIASGHPPQYAGVHLYRKTLTEDARKPPTRAGDFQEGPTIAYLIDFLDGGRIVHRVFVETTSTGPPGGRFPGRTQIERPVDVALLSMDAARAAARDQPSILDHIQPHTVIGLHWENFFRPKDRPPREAMKVNLPRIASHVDGRWRFPSWDAAYRFPDDLVRPGR